MKDLTKEEQKMIERFNKKFCLEGSECTWKDVNGLFVEEVTDFLLSEIRTAVEREKKRLKEVVSIEIEAWFGAHDELEKSFMSEDMIKQIVKRMEEV